jgi:hypothetical protein
MSQYGDMDALAILDTKHDLCDENPCRDCAEFAYLVYLGDSKINEFYGSNLFGQQESNAGRARAFELAKNLCGVASGLKVVIKVYANEMPDEESCRYEFASDGRYIKVG